MFHDYFKEQPLYALWSGHYQSFLSWLKTKKGLSEFEHRLFHLWFSLLTPVSIKDEQLHKRNLKKLLQNTATSKLDLFFQFYIILKVSGQKNNLVTERLQQLIKLRPLYRLIEYFWQKRLLSEFEMQNFYNQITVINNWEKPILSFYLYHLIGLVNSNHPLREKLRTFLIYVSIRFATDNSHTNDYSNQSIEAIKHNLANEGYPKAIYNYGLHLINVAKDDRSKINAFPYFKLAALSGDKDAQYLYAGYFYEGWQPVIKDHRISFRFFQFAAEKGDVRSQVNLGMMYQNGDGCKKNLRLAIKWYRIAMQKKDKSSFLNLGNLLYNSKNENDHRLALKIYLEGEKLFKDSRFSLYAGFCYLEGKGVKGNLELASQKFQIASKDNHYQAWFNLGVIEQRKPKTKSNLSTIITAFEKAESIKSNGNASYRLASIYSEKGTLYRSSEKTFNYLYDSYQKKYLKSFSYLANMYRLGDGVKKDMLKGLAILEEGILLNSKECLFEKAVWIESGLLSPLNIHDALKILNALAYSTQDKEGYFPALYKLATLLEHGYGLDLAPNFQEALKIYKTLAKQGQAEGYIQLARLSIEERGLRKDAKYIIHQLTKAADLGSQEAKYRLGEIYYYGHMVKENFPRAKVWLLSLKDSIQFPFAKDYLGKIDRALSQTENTTSFSELFDKFTPAIQPIAKDIRKSVDQYFSFYFTKNGIKWSNFTKNARIALVTGLTTHVLLHKGNYDYTSSILPMLKAVEIEVSEIFYYRYLDYLNEIKANPKQFINLKNEKAADQTLLIESNFKQNVSQYRLRTRQTAANFNLGSLVHLVGLATSRFQSNIANADTVTKIESISTARDHFTIDSNFKNTSEITALKQFVKVQELHPAFLEYCQLSLFKQTKILNQKDIITQYLERLVEDIHYLKEKYRNQAAHKNIVSFLTANEAIEDILKVREIFISIHKYLS